MRSPDRSGAGEADVLSGEASTGAVVSVELMGRSRTFGSGANLRCQRRRRGGGAAGPSDGSVIRDDGSAPTVVLGMAVRILDGPRTGLWPG
ncbi:hypothetical protein GCM10027268_19410 [Brachybacterium huguangmaarense]